MFWQCYVVDAWGPHPALLVWQTGRLKHSPMLALAACVLCVPFIPLQFGTLLTPADLKTLPGLALNLAAWGLNRVTPVLTDLQPSATDKLRQEFGLPWAAGPCALSEGLRRLWGAKTLRCRPLVQVMMSTWLVEYPRTLPGNTVLVGPGECTHVGIQ